MKKYTLVLALMAVLPMFSANSTEYETVTNEYYTTRPVKTRAYKKTTTSRKTGGYNNTITNNFYYGQPAQVSSYNVAHSRPVSRPVYEEVDYDEYVEPVYVVKEKKAKQVTESYSTQERKYFLAHPFFQPLKGKFGSVTDVSYARNSFNFNLIDGTTMGIKADGSKSADAPVYGPVDLGGKAKTTQFAIKEDVSIGLSDTTALVLMAQYDKTKVSFGDWSNGYPISDSMSDSGLNIFGIGLQNRFLDNDQWIAMVSGYFQHQRDTANSLIGEFKVGYKVNRNTFYGLGRVGYSDLIKGNTYGAFVKDKTGDYLMLAYQQDVEDVVYAEGGVGIFSVLSRYFTFNGELIYGYYDWHNQLSVKGALGWQPNDMFALNLYASTSLYDSANDKKLHYINYDVNPTDYPKDINDNPLFTDSAVLYTNGTYKIKDYDEWKIGVQAILYF